jgi:polysaccharide export outer membrane protein
MAVLAASATAPPAGALESAPSAPAAAVAPAAAAAAAAQDSAPAPGPAVAADYHLQPGDVLQLSVWKETDLQQEVLIRPDGGVSLPLAGELVAAGRTVPELQKEVAARIRHFIPDASVTVSLKLTSGNKVYVIGKVNHPGEFPLNRPIDVMQALGLAGGATPFADLNGIQILRRTGSQSAAISFHYTEVEHGRNLQQNILLASGDTVVVP